MRRTHRVLTLLALSLGLVTATSAVAVAAPTPSAIEDQHDRLLRNLEAGQAERTEAAVQLSRAMERNSAPVPASGVAAQPAPRTDTAVPGRDLNVLATLLVGLVGGLVGGGAAMAAWTAAARRRPHRTAPAA
jgi:hypothetical protein